AAVHAGDGRVRELAKRALGPLRGGLKTCEGLRIRARVVAVLLLELLGHVLDDGVVPILTAKVHVAFDRHALEVPLRQADERYVERAAAQIVDEDGALLVGQNVVGIEVDSSTWRLERVGECCRRRLVEDIQYLKTGDPPGVVRRLAPGLVEV